MKTKLSLFFLILALSPVPCALSQIPQGFNYQAIARDAGGNPLVTTSLPTRITIQADSLGTSIIWQEVHSTVTSNSFGLIGLVPGRGARQAASTVATFSSIDWSITPKFIKTEIFYSGSYKTMGVSRLWSVPYAAMAGDLAGSVDKLAVLGKTSGLEEALFEVKNKDGQTVFAVYNEGVRIYVSDGAKAVKGGFAVGGFGTDKAESAKYLFVGKDSVRIYLDTNPLTKGKKSGFAVGGYDLTKGAVQNYLDVSADSVRIYIDSNPATKKAKGGFAVGGYDMTKGTNTNYMNVNTDASGIINPSQNRILWYPLKNAFLTGKVLITSPTNVGDNSFASGYESRAKGAESQALGFKAIADGDYSTAIGKNAFASNINSFAFGDSPQATSNDSYAFGAGARAEGIGSYAFGSAGRDTLGNLIGDKTTASGDYSFAIGQGSTASGLLAIAFGSSASAIGTSSTAIGYEAVARGTWSTSMGTFSEANGDYSKAIGVFSIASGGASTAIGHQIYARSGFETAIGYYNTDYTPVSTKGKDPTDRLFVIGNGYNNMMRSDALTILKNGNVGIGTSNPTRNLDIITNNSSTQDMIVHIGEHSNEGGYLGSFTPSDLKMTGGSDFVSGSWIARDISSSHIRLLDGYTYFGNNTGLTVNNSFTPTVRMIITPQGNVGIGTEAPSAKLHVLNTLYVGSSTFTNPEGWGSVIDLNDAGTSLLQIRSGSAEGRLMVHTSGWWGSPAGALLIGTKTNNAMCLATNSTIRMTIASGGSVGIGTTAPNYTLDVRGTIGNNTTLYHSDLRWKTDINQIRYGISEIKNLIGVSYSWRATDYPDMGFDEGTQFGFIAQEFEKVIPELVRTDKDGYKSIDYVKLTPVLVEAIKEQQLQIDFQQKEIDELKTLVNKLMDKKTAQLE